MNSLHVLDGIEQAPRFYRAIYDGAVPPAEPPNAHCVWNEEWSAWVETDEHFRQRIKNRLEKKV